MAKKIGVEQSLSDVQAALQEKGYNVIQLQNENDANGCDACVITGLDSNVMGMADTSIEGPVIEANGLTADQICQEVESRINR